MARISDIWTYETEKTLPETFKALSTLAHVYDADTGFTELNTNIDITPFYIKATGENLFYGGVDMPRDAEQPTKTPIETSDTYLGLACIYNSGYYSNSLSTISMVDYTSYLIQKQPTLASTKKPVTRSYWNNSTSYQTRQQAILTSYDYTNIKVYATIVVCYKEGYNWRTTATSIKDCANYINNPNAKIVGISIDSVNYKGTVTKLPNNTTIVANITYDDMSLQTPLGNLTSDSDTPLRYTSDAVYDRLMINPIYLDLEANLIDGYYIPFKCNFDDTDTMCKMLASIGYIIECEVDDIHNIIYPIITNGMCDGSYTFDKKEFDEAENGKWTDTDNIPSPNPDAESETLAKQPLNPYALAERFFNRYLLTAQEMIDLKTALDSETMQEINAIQYVVNLSIVPDGLDDYYDTSPTTEIYFGRTVVNLPAKKVLGATSIIDFGSKKVSMKYNNFLDYEPYTKVSLYIPFCGKVNLPTDKVMGKTINVQVAFDYLDGNCTGYVFVDDSLITTVTGNFYCSVPLSQDVSMSKSIEYMFSSINWIGQGLGSLGVGLATQNPAIAIGGAISSTANFGNSLHDIMAKSDTNIVQGGGNLNAFNFPMECCLYYERPDVEIPELFGEINGFACHVSGQLKEFHGFTACSDFHLDGIVCTKIEKEMLDELLRKGVILD